MIQYVTVTIAPYKLELALAISFVSFGSSQILFLPHFMTAAASRFCRRIVLDTDTSEQTPDYNNIIAALLGNNSIQRGDNVQIVTGIEVNTEAHFLK